MLRILPSFLKVSLPNREFCKFAHDNPFVRKNPRGGPKYYPRSEDEPDPDIVPSKLFRIDRVKRLKGTTGKERATLRQLGIHREGAYVSVCKNIPEINKQLWTIKHLIRITPITFPYGEPTEKDINYTVLHENGECVVMKEVFADDAKIKLWEDIQDDPGRITGKTVQKNCRDKWLSGWNGGY